MDIRNCKIGVVCRFNAKLGGVSRDLLVREDLGRANQKEISVYGVPGEAAFDQFDKLVQHLISTRQLHLVTRRIPQGTKSEYNSGVAKRVIYSQRADFLPAPYTKRGDELVLLQPRTWQVDIMIDGSLGEESVKVRDGVEQTIGRARYTCTRLLLEDTQDGLEWLPSKDEPLLLDHFDKVVSSTGINHTYLFDVVSGLDQLYMDQRRYEMRSASLRELVK